MNAFEIKANTEYRLRRMITAEWTYKRNVSGYSHVKLIDFGMILIKLRLL